MAAASFAARVAARFRFVSSVRGLRLPLPDTDLIRALTGSPGDASKWFVLHHVTIKTVYTLRHWRGCQIVVAVDIDDGHVGSTKTPSSGLTLGWREKGRE